MTIHSQIATADQRLNELLQEMKALEGRLSVMKPADPKRRAERSRN